MPEAGYKVVFFTIPSLTGITLTIFQEAGRVMIIPAGLKAEVGIAI